MPKDKEVPEEESPVPEETLPPPPPEDTFDEDESFSF